MTLSARLASIGESLSAQCLVALGYPARMHTTDRQFLEQQILIALASDPTITSVLFVGCDWYTAHYERLLGGTTLYSIDRDPRRRRFGAARHAIGRLEDLDRLMPHLCFDAIVCNGVYGWGLDAADDCTHAFAACAHRLKPHGWFVFGWNNVPSRDPAPAARCRPPGFAAAPFGPVGVARLEIPQSYQRHTYEFYRRDVTVQMPADCSGGR